MGLFSIFDGKDSQGVDATPDGDDGNNASKASSSLSLDLPTLVQLYRSGSHPIRLESTALVPSYAMLSYSAVSVTAPTTSSTTDDADPSSSSSPSKSSRLQQQKKAAQVVAAAPELGVWNVCCVPNNSSKRSTSSSHTHSPLLLLPSHPVVSTFCFTVDLDDPALVEPTISALQDALVRYLVARPPPSTSTKLDEETAPSDGDQPSAGGSATSTAYTTTLHDLRTVSFGLAPDDADAAAKLGKSQEGINPDKDRSVRVALIICVKRRRQRQQQQRQQNDTASGKGEGGGNYRHKQSQALLHYHLRRYANALRATLCFVDDGDDFNTGKAAGIPESLADDVVGVGTGDNTAQWNEQPAVRAAQLAYIFRELAAGVPLNVSAPEICSPEGSAYAYVYTSSNHNPELIESVLLRNAHYPGEWDAAKQSLWKILPPPPSEGEGVPLPPSSSVSSPAPAGDNDWLAELRDSVAATSATGDAIKTPAKSTRKEVAPDTAHKDAAVSSFFEDLLK